MFKPTSRIKCNSQLVHRKQWYAQRRQYIPSKNLFLAFLEKEGRGHTGCRSLWLLCIAFGRGIALSLDSFRLLDIGCNSPVSFPRNCQRRIRTGRRKRKSNRKKNEEAGRGRWEMGSGVA